MPASAPVEDNDIDELDELFSHDAGTESTDGAAATATTTTTPTTTTLLLWL